MSFIKNIKKKFRYLSNIGIWNTLRLNFHYFPFKTAIRVPIIVSRQSRLRQLKGTVHIEKIKTGVIRFGLYNLGLFDNKKSRSIWDVGENSHIHFLGKASFGGGSKLCIMGGRVYFGDNFGITAESTIVCEEKIQFGENVLISWENLIMDTDFHKIFNHKEIIKNNPKEIKIGDNVWIGCRNTILKGAEIPDNCILGAGSLLTKKLEFKNSLYAGNPVILRESKITWEK